MIKQIRACLLASIFVSSLLSLTPSFQIALAEPNEASFGMTGSNGIQGIFESVFEGERFRVAAYIIENNGSHTFAFDKNGSIAWINEDAATVLNNAFSSALLQGGGRIVIRAAVYHIASTLKISGSNLELEGKKGAVFRTIADLSVTLQIASDFGVVVRNVRVSGLAFDGNNHKVTNPFHGVVWVYNAENIIFENVEITRSGIRENYLGYLLVPQAGFHARNVHRLLFNKCHVHDNLGAGVIVSSADGAVSEEIYVVHNRFIRTNLSNATGGYAAIDMRARNFQIAHNYIYRAPFGVHLAGNYTSNGYIFWNVMIGNAGDERIAESGIEVWTEGVSCIKIKHNYFAKWCYEKGGGGAGVELGNTYSSYVGDGVHHCEISHNTIDAGGYPSSLATYGITVNGKYNVVSRNTIYSPSAEGIWETGVSEFNQICNNKIRVAG